MGDSISCLCDGKLAFSRNFPIDVKIFTFRNHWFCRHAVIGSPMVNNLDCLQTRWHRACDFMVQNNWFRSEAWEMKCRTGRDDRFQVVTFVPGNGQNLANVHIFVHKHFGNTVI